MFRRRRNEPQHGNLRILFVTDLHGSETCFRKALAGVSVHRTDALVVGGDLTGKALRPLVETDDGYRIGIQDRDDGARLRTEEEVAEFEKGAAGSGAYAVKLSPGQAEALNDDSIDQLLRDHARTRARGWAEYAANRFSGSPTVCFVSGGNDDTDDILQVFRSVQSDNVVACDEDVVDLSENVQMASIGYSNPTPWHTPREVEESKLSEMIDGVVSTMREPGAGVFNLHVPPRGIGLDRCPELDTSTDPPTPIRVAGEVIFADAGSSAVLTSIERYQPRVGLHGHIHESRAAGRVGRTLCLNPGSDYRDGVLRAAIVTIGESQVRHQFIAG